MGGKAVSLDRAARLYKQPRVAEPLLIKEILVAEQQQRQCFLGGKEESGELAASPVFSGPTSEVRVRTPGPAVFLSSHPKTKTSRHLSKVVD